MTSIRPDLVRAIACGARDTHVLADRWLDQLVAAEDCVQGLTHPFGFVTAFVDRLADGGHVRLHIWPKPLLERQEPAWEIHSHQSRLCSYVLRGDITSTTFGVHPSTTGRHRLFRAQLHGEQSRLVATSERVELGSRHAASYSRGDRYDIPLATFHTSALVSDGFGATLVVAGPPEGGGALVVGEGDRDVVVRYERRPVSAETMLEFLRRVLEG
ncbi:MAG TPA: hypothetical protein VF529_17895 [Solirubrobacteraceae bacterium]|jgi:hypothetical protein